MRKAGGRTVAVEEAGVVAQAMRPSSVSVAKCRSAMWLQSSALLWALSLGAATLVPGASARADGGAGGGTDNVGNAAAGGNGGDIGQNGQAGQDAVSIFGTEAGGAGGAGSTSPGGAGGAGASGASNGNQGAGGGGGGGGSNGNGAGAQSAIVTAPLTAGDGGSGGSGGNGGQFNDGGGGGGGGAGGNGALQTGTGAILNNSSIAGGHGGAGGSGGRSQFRTGAGGGSGGDGGAGVLLDGMNGSLTNAGNIAGGAGGVGGAGGDSVFGTGGTGGSGGTGGAGVRFSGSGGVFSNMGTVKGGDGGTFGTAGVIIVNGQPGSPGTSGSGGAGVTGSNLAIVNFGSITGGLSGDGVTRANAITFTGGTNSLTITSTSTINGTVQAFSSADTFSLGGTTNGTFDVSQLGAQYQGFGNYTKTGGAIWTLIGTSTDNTPWTVNAGQLQVNGSIASAGVIMVNSGGTLSGIGTVPFTLLSDGATLAPGPTGSGTGMLTITDRVLFCDCSAYAVKVSSTGNDFVRVVAGAFGSGDAILGGSVRVTSPTSTYRFNSPYLILTANGGIQPGANGSPSRFASLSTPTGIAGTLSYTMNDVLLTLTSALGEIAGLNRNQRAVAGGVDTALNNGGNLGAFIDVFQGNIPQNLTQLSGEIATGAQQTTFNAMTQFMGVMTDPFIGGRDGAGSGGATAYADEAMAYAGRRSPRDALAAFTTKAPPRADTWERRWSVWAAGYGGGQTTSGDTVLGSNTATSRLAAGVVGVDYRIAPNTLAGFAMAGGGTSFSVANGGNGRSDLFQAGAFVRHTVGASYLTAALAYGWQDVTTDRAITVAGLDRLQARFNANAFSGRLEAGSRFAVLPGDVGLTPYAAAQFTSFALPTFAEQAIAGANTFALAFGSKTVTATRSEFGLRADASYALSDAILTLRGRAAWAHDFNADRSIQATFQSLPTASFTVNGARPARDAALTTASAELRWANGWSTVATFEGEFSANTRVHAGKGSVRYAW